MRLRLLSIVLIAFIAAPFALADDEGLPLPLPGRRPTSRPTSRPAPVNPTAIATLLYHGDDKPGKPAADTPAPPVPTGRRDGIINRLETDVTKPITHAGGGGGGGNAATPEPPAPEVEDAAAILRLQLRGVIRVENGKAIATIQTEQLEFTIKPGAPFNKRAKLGTERLEVRTRLRSWSLELSESQLQELGRTKQLQLPVSEPFTPLELLKGAPVRLTFLPIEIWEVITNSGSGGPR